jgi:two-component system CheB/CheR fusion protein
MTLEVQVTPLIGASQRPAAAVSVTFPMTRRVPAGCRTSSSRPNRQLETAYEELQSTNEELETTNEELQSTVEELETTNEELQSTNEELETTNAELQSMNGELQAANEELRDRTSEVSSLNSFMEAVLGSLRAGVVVVNREMIIQLWNRRAEDLWGLRGQETVGEHLPSLDSGLPPDRLQSAVREVILDGHQGREIRLDAVNRRGRTIRLHVTVTPLRSGAEHPDGVLILMESTELPPGP